MQRNLLFILFLGSVLAKVPAQQLVSVLPLGSKTQAQLVSEFGLPLVQFGTNYYRITYTTTNVQGQLDTVSGLVALPDDTTKTYPRLVYQHGTSGSKLDVPSFTANSSGTEGSVGLLAAGLGFIALLPDYLGLGVSDGFHPYVHAASEASVAIDMLKALPAFTATYGIHPNNQLFITGYSQGGHASMALHRAIETDTASPFTVTAAAHLSGPYSIGGVMRNLILSDSIYYYPAYLPNTILSYQTVYGNLYNQIGDVFKAPYATTIDLFFKGSISLNTLNNQLIAQLTANEGAPRPLRMLQPAMVQAVESDPNHPFNIALRENNVYAWAPKAPTRIFYCMADDQVPYQNSLIAFDTMTMLGAVNLVAQDVNPQADHGECYLPALTNTIFFFLNYRQIGAYTATGDPAVAALRFYPNPANQTILLQNLPAGGRLQVFDIGGQLRLTGRPDAGDARLDVSGLENGLYLMRFETASGVRQGKLIVQH